MLARLVAEHSGGSASGDRGGATRGRALTEAAAQLEIEGRSRRPPTVAVCVVCKLSEKIKQMIAF